MNASITVPAFKPDKETMDKLVDAVKKQKLDGKLELIIVDKGWGFSKQMNYGIQKSKYDIVIMLPQDCIPKGTDWAKNLIEQFKDINPYKHKNFYSSRLNIGQNIPHIKNNFI